MDQSLQLNIKSSIFDRVRQLIINRDYIEFDNKDLVSSLPARFLKNDIAELKYGIKWINGYQFTIGRIYCIDIRDSNNEIIKIRLKSIYGIRKKELSEKYSKIVNVLYDNFFYDISGSYLNKFIAEKEFEIAGVRFTQNGIVLNEKYGTVFWEDIETRAYHSYYAICSISNSGIYRTVEYLTEWNAGILYSVLRQILKEKGLLS